MGRLVVESRRYGGSSFKLEGYAPRQCNALHRFDHVKKVTPESLAGGWTRYTVWVDSGTDTREHIAQLASQYGWPLRSFFRHVATLEDVFVELTRKD